MPRTKTGVVRRRGHKKLLERTKGFRMTKNRLVKVAMEADLHASQYAFIGRKLRKRNFRSLWIVRISAAVKAIDPSMNYSRFMHSLKTAKIDLDRKMLSELAINDPKAFEAVVKQVVK
ncbi:MAG: 50S ribosomal protein L20 [Patescibacteria group bacterium]